MPFGCASPSNCASSPVGDVVVVFTAVAMRERSVKRENGRGDDV